SNVLMAGGTRAKLADFGLAKVLDEKSLTATGAMVGTPLYMAPEQVNAARATPLTDIYGLGAVLYSCLTGDAPFDAPRAEALFKKILFEPPPSLRTKRPEVPEWLDAAILRCLEKDPAKRFQTPEAARRALEPPAPPSAELAAAAPPVASSRAAALGAFAALIVAAALVGGVAARLRGPRPPAPGPTPPPPPAVVP